ncbi:MAG: methylmalonyl-CoA epimerase [bacterium]|jgi:methylmalonyl-CoA/ethylmalonyl-CoA epimerase
MIGKISHIGIAVQSIENAAKLYTDVFGLLEAGREEVPDQKVKVCFIPVGESRVELLEPTDPEGAVAKFIANKGEGIHHIAYEVEDLVKALAICREKGLRLIDETPRRGAGGAMIAFLHPKSTGGVLVELCEHAPAADNDVEG